MTEQLVSLPLKAYLYKLELVVLSKVHSPTNALLLIKKHIKIYIKIHINNAPTCFGLGPSSGSLALNLAEVIFMLKHSVKLRRYFTECFNINITLARFNARLPDDGRRPKHIGAIFMCILM